MKNPHAFRPGSVKIAVFVVEQARKAYDIVSGCMGTIESRSIIPDSPTDDSRLPTPHHSGVTGIDMKGHWCCPAVRSRRRISLNFCGSVAERKTQYARLTKLYLQPLNSDRAGIAISLWAAEMPARATIKFMCLEARIPLLNSLCIAVYNIFCNENCRPNN